MAADTHMSTGAYALDALPDAERATFERHLAECPACTEEVHELRETAALLGVAAAVHPPQRLRERVLAEAARTRQLAPVVRHRGTRPRRWTTWVAAAAVLVIAGLGVQVYRGQQQIDAAQQQVAAITAVLGAPDAVTERGTGPGGSAGTAVVSAHAHRVVVLMSGLPAVAGNRAYQLWLMGPYGAHSAGLLQSGHPVVTDLVAGTKEVGLTVEPAGGSPQPTTRPVMTLSVA